MFGLVLDFHWKAAYDPSVDVTLIGSLDELRRVSGVDTHSAVDNWLRRDVIPLEARTVTSDFTGGELVAFICKRRDTAPVNA